MAIKRSTGDFNSLLEKTKEDYTLGFIDIYTGSQPSSSNNASTDTLLATVSIDAGGGGLTFDTPSGVTMGIPGGINWQYIGLATGTAGWFRLRTATDTNVTSTTEKRIDGSVGTTSGDMKISNINIALNSPGTVQSCDIVLSNV